MPTQLYPLVFRPLLVSSPTGGGLLSPYLAGGYGELAEPPSAAWLLFDDGKRSSCIANGPLEGTPLGQLVGTCPDELVGCRHPGGAIFPLAIRLLDIGQDQPLQVHPDVDVLPAGDTLTNACFWHSLACRAGARVIVGISLQVTNQQILLNLDKPGFERLLQTYPARRGDSYLVPPGFVHALSAGNLIFEVRQNCRDPLVLRAGREAGSQANGDRQKVLAAVKREARHNLRISREASAATYTRRLQLTPNCPYFQVEEIRLHDHIFLRTTGDSFNLIAVTHGQAQLLWQDQSVSLGPGLLCCVPACCGDYKIDATCGPATLLRLQS